MIVTGIAVDLEAALAQLANIAEDLKGKGVGSPHHQPSILFQGHGVKLARRNGRHSRASARAVVAQPAAVIEMN